MIMASTWIIIPLILHRRILIRPKPEIHIHLHVLLEIRECAAEGTREAGVVRFEQGSDAFVVEGVGAGGDEEGLPD
jgi:hypothetical protein